MKKTHQQPVNIRMTVAAVAAVILVSSCTTVKEYQKNKLNDSEMTLSARKVEKTEMSFQTYREGASGANGGKTGGGCGCN
jgi:outer membrane murein-binding lipoprotein Lpp